MVHPLLQRQVPYEVLQDRRARAEEAAWPAYRSEAFAEDLPLPEPSAPVKRRMSRVLPALLAGAPLLAAVLGGAAALLGHRG